MNTKTQDEPKGFRGPHCHRKLNQGLDSLGAFMKQTYPGRKLISISQKKQTNIS
ncbi:MAG TPA: hypothetical protein VKM94_02270 [Blastocatellia bacterium]|nr:hypothetical protein [Blastocatellia bacterium]